MGTKTEALETIEQSIWRQLRRAVKDRRSLRTPRPSPRRARRYAAPTHRRAARLRRRGSNADVPHRRARPSGSSSAPTREWRCTSISPNPSCSIASKASPRAPEHGTPATQAKWDSMNSSARDCYRVQTAPGTPIPAPRSRKQETAGALGGYPAFARIHVQVASIDWLYLAAVGHRRA